VRGKKGIKEEEERGIWMGKPFAAVLVPVLQSERQSLRFDLDDPTSMGELGTNKEF